MIDKFALVFFAMLFTFGCHKVNELHICDDIYIEKDYIDNVYIITRKISEKTSTYMVVGDVEWVAVSKNYIFGYKSSYKTNTFLETESNFYFVIECAKSRSTPDEYLKEFSDETSMRIHLKTKGCVEPYTYLSFKK